MNNVPSELSHNSFLAKVYKLSRRTSCRNFIAKIISGPHSDNDNEEAFLKRSSKVRSGFVSPGIEVLASVSYYDVMLFSFYKLHFLWLKQPDCQKFLGLLTIYLGLTLQPRQCFVV